MAAATAVAPLATVDREVVARRRFSDHVVALALRSLALVVGILPPALFVPLGRLVGRVGHAVGLRKKIVQRNIALAFASMSPADQERLVREVYENACISLLWFLHVQAFDRWRHMERYVDMAFPSAYEADLRDGHVIVTSAHLGCWELLPCVHAPPNLPVCQVYELYRPLHNSPLNAWLIGLRSYPHTRLLPDKNCLHTLTKVLAAPIHCRDPTDLNNTTTSTSRSSIVALVCDQRPSRSGVAVAFLGHPTLMAPGAAVLRQRTRRPVWFTALTLAPPGHSKPFLLHTLPILRDTRNNVDSAEEQPSVQEIMQQYASTVSSLVQAFPSQYLWFHALWKTAH